MKKIFIIIISLSFSLIAYPQDKDILTDSTFVRGHKFVLIETEDRVAEIKAFLGEQEVPISGVIKMPPPVYFIKENGTNKIMQDDFIIKNEGGDIATIFLIVGGEAPLCSRKGEIIKFKDDFCGMNVQGIVISPDGISLTEFLDYGFTCTRSHPLEMKDLYLFVHQHFKIKRKKTVKKNKKKTTKK